MCRRYLWAVDRPVMTRRPGTVSHLSLKADKMKIYKTASHSHCNHSTPWLVSKNGFIDNSCNVLLSWHTWWLRWWCCCCCSGLKILFLESSGMMVRQISFKKKHSFSSHCCRKTEALTPAHVKYLEMRNQVMNKPLF